LANNVGKRSVLTFFSLLVPSPSLQQDNWALDTLYEEAVKQRNKAMRAASTRRYREKKRAQEEAQIDADNAAAEAEGPICDSSDEDGPEEELAVYSSYSVFLDGIWYHHEDGKDCPEYEEAKKKFEEAKQQRRKSLRNENQRRNRAKKKTEREAQKKVEDDVAAKAEGITASSSGDDGPRECGSCYDVSYDEDSAEVSLEEVGISDAKYCPDFDGEFDEFSAAAGGSGEDGDGGGCSGGGGDEGRAETSWSSSPRHNRPRSNETAPAPIAAAHASASPASSSSLSPSSSSSISSSSSLPVSF